MRRGAAIALLVLWPVASLHAEVISDATYTDPTERYAHAVLGDAVEYGALEITTTNLPVGSKLVTKTVLRNKTILIHLPLDHVFEDIAPRLADVDGEPGPEVIVVETDVAKGAQLAVYDVKGQKIAETPHIGQTHRWLAPIGAADLDGDGHVEIAYIDRPHLARTLRIWRYVGGELVEVATAQGLTNHRIGEDFITGGIRDCNGRPEMITVDAGWSRIIASRFGDGTIRQTDIGPYQGRQSVEAALACD